MIKPCELNFLWAKPKRFLLGLVFLSSEKHTQEQSFAVRFEEAVDPRISGFPRDNRRKRIQVSQPPISANVPCGTYMF
jgi:hypothetical protein